MDLVRVIDHRQRRRSWQIFLISHPEFVEFCSLDFNNPLLRTIPTILLGSPIPALLQILIRDYPGYVQSRGKILQRRLQFRQNWKGLSAAHHLAGSYLEAENVLKKYEETLRNAPGIGDIEHSEVCLHTVDTIQWLDKSLGDCGLVRHARASKGYLAKGR